MFVRIFLVIALTFSIAHAESVFIPELELNDIITADLNELECLAVTIYHEARGETLEGQQYVAQVIMNRVRVGWRGGKTVCDIVRQKAQFSFAFDGQTDRVDGNRTAFMLAYIIAVNFYHLKFTVDDPHALEYYHYVNPDKLVRMPSWSAGMLLKRVGNHLFMRK